MSEDWVRFITVTSTQLEYAYRRCAVCGTLYAVPSLATECEDRHAQRTKP